MTPTLDTAGLSAQEIADRRAIQAVWIKYWDITSRILATPKSERSQALASVSIPDQAKNVLNQVAIYEKNGWDNYGTVIHRPYWGPSVDGKDAAIMGDCLDSSKAGKKDSKTGQELTVGPPRDNARASFTRTADGKWLVVGVQFLADVKC